MRPSSTQTPGVAETVALGRTLGRLPRRLVIVGVEAERFEFGAPLSPAVEQALEPLVRLVVREFEACRTGSQAGSASA
jgi:hydrogenase maturation protease